MRRAVATAPLVALLAFAAGCGGGDGARTSSGKRIQADKANAGKTITLGSKGFTESLIVAQIYGQSLAAAEYQVTSTSTSPRGRQEPVPAGARGSRLLSSYSIEDQVI